MDRPSVPQATEWQRIGNQIDAAMIFARADFVKVRWLHGMVRCKRFLAYPITESSPIIMSSLLNGGAGLAGKSGRKTANACDTNAIEMSAETTAHFIFVARNIFIKVPNIVVR